MTSETDNSKPRMRIPETVSIRSIQLINDPNNRTTHGGGKNGNVFLDYCPDRFDRVDVACCS